MMLCAHDHTFPHPRVCLVHLMSVNVTAHLISLGVACRSFLYLDPPCHLTNLALILDGLRCRMARNKAKKD